MKSTTCSGVHDPGGFSVRPRAVMPVKVEPGTSKCAVTGQPANVAQRVSQTFSQYLYPGLGDVVGGVTGRAGDALFRARVDDEIDDAYTACTRLPRRCSTRERQPRSHYERWQRVLSVNLWASSPSRCQGRQLLQCQRCRYQTSLIAGTVLQGTKLPMRVWFRAMHR